MQHYTKINISNATKDLNILHRNCTSSYRESGYSVSFQYQCSLGMLFGNEVSSTIMETHACTGNLLVLAI